MSDRRHFSLVGEPHADEPYHYQGCGLDNVYLLNGFTLEKSPYGDGVSIRELDDLHAEIGFFLASEKKNLSGKELRFLRHHLDLSQVELGNLLGVSAQSVARWEKDQSSKGNPAAENLLRILFLDQCREDVDVKECLTSLSRRDDLAEIDLVFRSTDHGWEGDQLRVAVGM